MPRILRWVAHWMRRLPTRPLLTLGARLVVARHRVAAAVVVFDEQDRVLLLNHVFNPAEWWGLPGGWLHRHESPQNAAVRELREETGLEATLGPVALVAREPEAHHLVVFFLAEVRPQPFRLSSEILEARWVALDDLPERMPVSTRTAIHEAADLRRRLASSSTVRA